MVGVALGVTVCGCYESEAPDRPDAGPPADGGPPIPPLSVGLSSTDERANFRCRGEPTWPAAAADDYVVRLVGRRTGKVFGVTFRFFAPRASPLDACAPPCEEHTVERASERFVSPFPEGWPGYRVLSGPATDYEGAPVAVLPSIGVGVRGGNRRPFTAVDEAVWEEWQRHGAIAAPMIAGRVEDCDGALVSNAWIRVFDGDEELTGPRGVQVLYGSGPPLPAFERTRSGASCSDHRCVDPLQYFAMDVPVPTDRTLRVEAWGSTEPWREPEMIGCEEAPVLERGFSFIDIGPTRADGPGGCSGAGRD
ncbi:MAG TPA: hypothetical protein RMH99_19820 [Sandaracinaceae bacterium LLY-WYZ-13_1]|nr:hypothetical protein [Sandaracinaceae bacterium LLY-WYZ-13_1]